MKVTKKDGTNERRIMIGMIVDTTVLGRIASRWTRESFRSKWCNLVGGWCVKFFAKYGQAPGNKIEGLYESWATDAKDKETLGLVESFLGGLSNEYETEKETSNSQYLIDLAEKHFNENRVRQLHEALGGDLDTGDLDRAIARIDGFDQVRVADVVETDLFNDETALAEAFDDSETDSLISLPGDLGLFYGAELARDCLVSFMAPEKRGKTFMLLDLAFRAAVQRRRVAFFGVGDMTRKQMIRRFASRASACPIKSQKVKFPKKIAREEDERYASVVIEEVDQKGLGLAGARKAFKKVVNHKIRSRHCYLKLLCVPNSTMSAADVIAKLRQWERVDEWSPDVVCLASGTGVLTDRGLIPIELVRGSDRLWDGVQWVSHGGLVYKGERSVVTYAGLTATPDHEVWTEDGWRTLESCRRLGLRVAQTGSGRQKIRIGESYIIDHPAPELSPVCFCSVCPLCGREMGVPPEHKKRDRIRMPKLQTTEEISHMVLASRPRSQATMSESKSHQMESVRRAGDRVSISIRFGGMSLDHKESWNSRSKTRIGSDRQRWPLRAWESLSFNSSTKQLSYEQGEYDNPNAQLPNKIPRCSLCGFDVDPILQSRYGIEGDHPSLPVNTKKMPKSSVWDLVNAGPLHRFTAQGLLVHNCIDYADILAPPTGVTDVRERIDVTWRELRSMTQQFHCLGVTATQSRADSYEAKTLEMKHFSNDKRKLAHVTAMIGINQTKAEKAVDVTRLNFILRREAENNPYRCLHAAGCRAIANPIVRSTF